MNRKGILATGNWIIDQIKIIDDYPPQDALANILSLDFKNGGSPYNILKDLSKLGFAHPMEGVGLVGDDANGEKIINDCTLHRISTERILKVKTADTSYTDVMTSKSTGRRTFFHARGANAQLDIEHVQLTDSSCKIFHLGYLLLLDKLDEIGSDGRTGASHLFDKAAQLGFKTSADVVSESGDRFLSIVKPSLPFIDYLFVNEYEAEKITGIPITAYEGVDVDKAIEAAGALIDMGVKDLVILHYPKGCVAVGKHKQVTRQGSVKIPRDMIAGAAGAGDAFAAGVLYGLHEDFSMQDCLKLGVCSAASSLFAPGCSDGILPVHEVLELGNKFGFHSA